MTMIDIKTLPLPELLLSRAAKHPDRDCIVLEGERVTYGELEVRSRQVALSLVAQGVEPGDRVGILMANCVDFVASMFQK